MQVESNIEKLWKAKSQRKLKRILLVSIGVVLGLVFFFLCFSYFSYDEQVLENVGFGANIENVFLSEDGKSVSVDLSGGANLENVSKVKFLFKSNGKEYVYETEDGVGNISVPYNVSFWHKLFGVSPDYRGVYGYNFSLDKVNGLSDFEDIEEVSVVFEYVFPEVDEKVKNVISTPVLDRQEEVKRVVGGGGGGSSGGSSGGGTVLGCLPIPVPQCNLTNTYWNTTSVENGTVVQLIVNGTNCDSEEISFIIYEDDLMGDDLVDINPVNVVFSGDSAVSSWISEYQEDGGTNPEYYFVVTLVSNGSESVSSVGNDLLEVSGGQMVITNSPTKVIANWDVVPYQVFNSTFKIGVVAFHEDGVEVDFKVEQSGIQVGQNVIVSKPTYNDRTDVYEYWMELDASDYSDGGINITFNASSDVQGHFSRSKSLVLYANAGGTLTGYHPESVVWADCNSGSDVSGDGSEGNPYGTLERGYSEVSAGGTLYLKSGSCYELTNNVVPGYMNYAYWTTVSAAPGVSRGDVQVRGGSLSQSYGRFSENRIKWEKLSLYKEDVKNSWGCLYVFDANHFVWFNNVELFDANGYGDDDSFAFNPQGGLIFVTNSLIRDIGNVGGASAFYDGNEFWRNCSFNKIGCDIWRAHSNLFAVNIDASDMIPAPFAHSDFIQTIPNLEAENVILYNVFIKGLYGQGVQSGGFLNNSAFVNLFVERPINYISTSSFDMMEHVLLWHSNFYGVPVNFFGTSDNNNDFYIQNNIFQKFFPEVGAQDPAPTEVEGMSASYNHYETRHWNQRNAPGGLIGINYTGDEFAGYVNSSSLVDAWRTNYGNGLSYSVGNVVYKIGEGAGYYRCINAHTAFESSPCPPGVGEDYNSSREYLHLAGNTDQPEEEFTTSNICRYDGNVWRALQDSQGVTPQEGAYWTQIGDWQDYWELLPNSYDVGVPYNYHLQVSSPAYGAGIPHECVPADINGVLYDSDSPNLGAFAFCTPDCAGKECGSDGCGGSCGSCGDSYVCNESGKCVEEVDSCSPATCLELGYECGTWANGTCSGILDCGSCSYGYSCVDGSCIDSSSGNVDVKIDVFTMQGLAPFTVLFNGFNSSSNIGEIVDYYWDFHDSNSQYERYDVGRMVGHRFDNSGNYTVELIVTDEFGNSNVGNITVEVLDSPVSANTYYVANAEDGGDDSNDGLCPTDEGTCGPWETFDKVISEASSISEGSQVLFNRGDIFSITITNEELNTASLGELMRVAPYYIKIGAYGEGSIPTFNGGFDTGYVSENQGIIIEDIHLTGSFISASHYPFTYPGHQGFVRNCIFDSAFGGWSTSGVTYENVLVDGAGGSCGPDFQCYSEYIYWNNVSVFNSPGHGVYFASELIDRETPVSNILIENCEFAYNGLGENVRDAFTIHGFVDNFIFRNNEVHHNGFALGWDSAYMGNTVEFNRNFILEDCKIHDQVYYTTQFSSQQNFTIRNNLFYNNPSSVINIMVPHNYDGYNDEDSSNVEIYNNVFYNNTNGYQESLINLDENQVHDVYIYNNIFYDNDGMSFILRDRDAEDLVISNNLYYDNNPALVDFSVNGVDYNLLSWMSSGNELNVVNENPLFVDDSNYNFRLQSGSHVIDAGVNVSCLWDMDGNSRPQGSAYDIGAYEYVEEIQGSSFEVESSKITGYSLWDKILRVFE